MRRGRLIVGEICAPLVVGTALYMLARPRGLLAFSWADAIGLQGVLSTLRALVFPLASRLPAFVRFSLPDGLWAMSFTAAMALVWRHRWSRASAPWILLAPILAVGSEVGQLFGVVPGTFDVVDLVCVTAGAIAGLLRVRPTSFSGHAISPRERKGELNG